MLRQSFLPGFSDGTVKIGNSVSMLMKDGRVTYFIGSDNYFSHGEDDEQSRRFVLTSLVENGHARARDLEQSLHIPHRTVMNWMKQYREEGPASFYHSAPTSRARIMTEEKSLECARLIAEGLPMAEVARRAQVQESTLRKAQKRKAIPQLPGILVGESQKKRRRSEQKRT